MGTLSESERDDFLAGRRYGIFSTSRDNGIPASVPVWFEWDGRVARMFTHVTTPKLIRLRRDPRAALLVVNHPDEKEQWVSLKGTVAVRDEGGLELAERLVPRYWLEGDPRAAALDAWRVMGDQWRLLELTPTTIRTYRD